MALNNHHSFTTKKDETDADLLVCEFEKNIGSISVEKAKKSSRNLIKTPIRWLVLSRPCTSSLFIKKSLNTRGKLSGKEMFLSQKG